MMLFIPPYARTNNRAMITQAFAPKTLMGLSGCGCTGSAGADGVMRNLAGLGVFEDPYCSDPKNRFLDNTGTKCFDTCKKDGVLLGVIEVDPSECGIGVFPSAPVDTNKKSSPISAVCDDTSLWKVGLAATGKCVSYCSADATQWYELNESDCAKGGGSGSGSKIPTSALILGVVGAGLVMMAISQ